MYWNRSKFFPPRLKTAATIGGWVGVYLLGSCLYFSLTYHLVESMPALLIPLLMPLSTLSAWVSWRIEGEIEPFFVHPSVNQVKASILPLLYMSVFYSSVVEGFLYEWFLHGGLHPWLRIGLDLLWLSPFFTDAAATYVYKRLLGDNHQNATDYVSTRLPCFVVPLLGFWFVFSVAGNEASNPILSFMIFDFGIIVWTVFFTWANQVDLPQGLRVSRYAFLRRLGILNDILSWPLGRVYRWKHFGSYLLDLLILIYSLAIASELWLADAAGPTTLAAIMVLIFAIWKGREFWSGNLRPADSTRTPTFTPEQRREKIYAFGEIRLYSSDAGSFPGEDAAQLGLKLDDPVLASTLSVENPRHPLER